MRRRQHASAGRPQCRACVIASRLSFRHAYTRRGGSSCIGRRWPFEWWTLAWPLQLAGRRQLEVCLGTARSPAAGSTRLAAVLPLARRYLCLSRSRSGWRSGWICGWRSRRRPILPVTAALRAAAVAHPRCEGSTGIRCLPTSVALAATDCAHLPFVGHRRLGLHRQRRCRHRHLDARSACGGGAAACRVRGEPSQDERTAHACVATGGTASAVINP